MLYRMLGASGVKVSPLCLGSMNFGNDAWGCDAKTSRAVIDAYLDAGGNFIDTANVYSGGRSEEIIGKALEGRRDEVILATKGYFPMGEGPNQAGNSRRNLRQQVEESLVRLRTDYIDLYQLHIWDPLTPIEETLGVLSDLVHEGKINYLGCCNFSAWQITVAMERADQLGFEKFVTVQPQYNLLCRDIEIEVMGAADLYEMGILPWSPLAFGILAGKYSLRGETTEPDARLDDLQEEDIMTKWKDRYFTSENFAVVEVLKAQAAELGTTPVAISLNWLLEQPNVTSAIIGPRNVEQLTGNLEALTIELPADFIDQIEEMTEPYETYLDFMQGGTFMRRMMDLE